MTDGHSHSPDRSLLVPPDSRRSSTRRSWSSF